ncbi:hypothetical protein FOZ63_006143, partial [Perkinsus olseni]
WCCPSDGNMFARCPDLLRTLRDRREEDISQIACTSECQGTGAPPPPPPPRARRRGRGKAARRKEFLLLCQHEFERRRSLSEDELKGLARQAGCDGDVECEVLISEANYNGFILKKAGNVYEYCR